VIAYVRALHGCGFSVVFVSNAGNLLPDGLTALQPFCRAIIIRRNVGYDFGAVAEVLGFLDLPQPETERLVIANDSVFGPLRPIEEMMERVDFNEADLWGATESWQYRYHLQSYFLVAGRRAMTSHAWQAFWRSVRQVSSKQWVVARYEVGITQMMLRAGLRCRPLWPYHELLDHVVCESKSKEALRSTDDPLEKMRAYANERLRSAAAKRAALNPTADLWRQLLLAGFPFLKVELLRKNQLTSPMWRIGVRCWRKYPAPIWQ
jgi:lipopolysaccharide biosynthesis protein